MENSENITPWVVISFRFVFLFIFVSHNIGLDQVIGISFPFSSEKSDFSFFASCLDIEMKRLLWVNFRWLSQFLFALKKAYFCFSNISEQVSTFRPNALFLKPKCFQGQKKKMKSTSYLIGWNCESCNWMNYFQSIIDGYV